MQYPILQGRNGGDIVRKHKTVQLAQNDFLLVTAKIITKALKDRLKQ
jgi:hypothetical protein